MARPKGKQPPKEAVSGRVPLSVLEELDAIAQDQRQSRSAIVGIILEASVAALRKAPALMTEWKRTYLVAEAPLSKRR